MKIIEILPWFCWFNEDLSMVPWGVFLSCLFLFSVHDLYFLFIVIDDLSHEEFIVFHSYYLWCHSQYKIIYISSDVSKFQCEKHRKLVQELKQRKEGGEKHHNI